jgi:phospholipase C
VRAARLSSLLAGALLALLAPGAGAAVRPATPVEHVVVIFQENVSFDHYFATYPNAANPRGEPAFHARGNTPSVNGLSPGLSFANPNLSNPARLDRSQALTCDQDHAYTAEQKAYDGGLVDAFVQNTGSTGSGCDPTQVMDYFDGNTVTAWWSVAQHFALSDNHYGSTFGQSTAGALNLTSGQTHGMTPALAGRVANGTLVQDTDPAFDDCSASPTVQSSARNVGDLLNARGVTWGWFEGGFRPSSRNPDGTAVCATSHPNIGGAEVVDYIPHHEPFQYASSTANPHHLPPQSTKTIGHTDRANHQYDLSDFWDAANASRVPAVSFLKAPGYQDGHAGYSDPLDEQHFLAHTINDIERLPIWPETAIIVAYDDSDGWYDHVMPPIVNRSDDPANDALLGSGLCGTPPQGAYLDRCGYGPRLPLMVISPFAKTNHVDHALTDQTSILRFVEENWRLGRIGDQSFDALSGSIRGMFDFARERPAPPLFVNAGTGLPKGS